MTNSTKLKSGKRHLEEDKPLEDKGRLVHEEKIEKGKVGRQPLNTNIKKHHVYYFLKTISSCTEDTYELPAQPFSQRILSFFKIYNFKSYKIYPFSVPRLFVWSVIERDIKAKSLMAFVIMFEKKTDANISNDSTFYSLKGFFLLSKWYKILSEDETQ